MGSLADLTAPAGGGVGGRTVDGNIVAREVPAFNPRGEDGWAKKMKNEGQDRQLGVHRSQLGGAQLGTEMNGALTRKSDKVVPIEHTKGRLSLGLSRVVAREVAASMGPLAVDEEKQTKAYHRAEEVHVGFWVDGAFWVNWMVGRVLGGEERSGPAVLR